MPERPEHHSTHRGAEGIDATVAAVLAHREGVDDAWPVDVLNPEAGHHHVTVDPGELRAALRAGEQSRRRFAYYERRYGERGRRFTQSDSAWIVTLVTQPRDIAEGQLRWLGALLAARGMPRWLLEEHLAVLHSELVRGLPDRPAAYDELRRVSVVLRDERLSRLDAETTSALVRDFDRRVDPAPVTGVPEAGSLLVAAVADELAGVDRAVESLLAWLADPARFPERWVTAATAVVAAAREAGS